VLTVRAGRAARVVAFLDRGLFTVFGLPSELPSDADALDRK
jgi:hypothetical protein